MALNAVLAALLKEFSGNQQIAELAEAEQFEHFANFTIVSELFGGDFNHADVSTGNQEFGLDGIAIIANGNIVDEQEEVDDLVAKNKNLEVEFIFTQAKTASSFDGGDLLKTLTAVEDFFGSLKLLQGDRVKDRFAIKDYIYLNAVHFRRGSPNRLLKKAARRR